MEAILKEVEELYDRVRALQGASPKTPTGRHWRAEATDVPDGASIHRPVVDPRQRIPDWETSVGLKFPDGVPCYNGEDPPETYLIQVQLASQLNAWSAEETAVQVALALEGKALQILTDLQPEERFNWQAIERALKHRFCRHAHADDARDKLVSRQREEGESLGGYAADLCFYARHGYPTFHAEVQDELALQAFVRGLQPERLREHIRLHAPKTLTAALAESERVEHVLSTGDRSTNTRYRVRQAAYEGRDDEEVTRQATTTPPKQPQRGTRRTAGQPTERCYRCGEPGHIARHCPAPAPRSPVPQPPLN